MKPKTALTCIPGVGSTCRWTILLASFLLAPPAFSGLIVEDLGKTYTRDPQKTPPHLFASASNTGGSTSVRRENRATLDWKTQGYFQRSRELGQVFNLPAGEKIKLDAIVLRTGNSSSAILEGTGEAPVYLQVFEVIGTPTINDNGTPQGTDATHGFTTNHRADDFIDGVTYQSLVVATGGNFPDLDATTQNGGQPGHLRYLRWDLTGTDELTLQGGKRYLFIVGFTIDSPDQGFTLGNDNLASSPAAPELRTDDNGTVWWCVRREGDGTTPPTYVPGPNPPTDPELRTQLEDESLFPTGHQLTQLPTADGYPDVDTYRELEFYIEVKEAGADPAETKTGSILREMDFSQDPGWSGSANDGGPDDYGYRASNRAAGAATGEIGGIFDRGNGYSYYADTSGNFSFGASDTIRGSGRFLLEAVAGQSANDDVFFGHITTTGGNTPDFLIGFRLRDPNGGANFRLDVLAGGAVLYAGRVTAAVAHTFSYEWLPDGSFTATLDGSTLVSTNVPRGTVVVDGFGMANRDRMNDTTGQGFAVYLDDVEYSVVGEGMKIMRTQWSPEESMAMFDYQSIDGAVFEVERSPDLDDWETINPTASGNGGVMQYIDQPPTATGPWFYRLYCE